DVTLLAHDAEQNALGGAPLVSGNHMMIAKDVLDGLTEVIKALASGIALVALHNGSPLIGGHGAGTGIGKQIDQHVFGGKQEKIVEGRFEQFFALAASGPADRLDRLDAERLDDGLRHAAQFSSYRTHAEVDKCQ